MIVIGIDPGLKGAMAKLVNDSPAWTADLPTMDRPSGKGRQINGACLAEQLRHRNEVRVFIERVSAMPGQGVTGVFSFGFTAGVIDGVCAALGLPVEYVSPQVWKRHHGLLGKDKEASRARAIRMFPALAGQLSRKKDADRAEALLIAAYGLTRLK